MKPKYTLLTIIALLALAAFACGNLELGTRDEAPTEAPEKEPTHTPNLQAPVPAGESNPDEPVLVTGTIPFTSPFFLDGARTGFVLLEDQGGFVARDEEFAFPLAGQAIGPIEQIDDSTFSFSLSLPAVPQATLNDVDNDGETDKGVMIFQVAYWNNTWEGPFLEERDGHGWSSGYTTASTDPNRDYEIDGGHLMVWAPDDEQGFPSGFGDDNMLFTEDDPIQSIPAGYSIVNLDADPFEVYKQANPVFELLEGAGAVKDYSEMSYEDAFNTLIERVAVEYPFTEDKGIDWDALAAEYGERVKSVSSENDWADFLHDFTLEIPDAHVGVTLSGDVFYTQQGGGFGMILAELSDGRVIVTDVFPGYPADFEGIAVGAEIITWDGQPVKQALDAVEPYFGPYSTEHHKQVEKAIFLTRYPVNTDVEMTYQNPGGSPVDTVLKAEVDYDSLFAAYPSFTLDEMILPLEAEVLDDSGLGYIRITTFSDDYALMATMWERFIQDLIDNGIPGVILDLRINGGGSGALASDFAGYFFDEEIEVYQRSYYNELLGEWEYGEFPATIEPGPLYYDGEVAVLVSPTCVSACEGFAAMLTENNRATIIGHYPTAGAFGEVGRGQYDMPDGYSMQFPTGRPETMDGELYIEDVGVVPDIVVPVTEESALGQVDAVLQAAIDELR
ncbi:MAG: hypothetical protein JXB38_09570 [Anaerolineales bacterium]|nr:hypothetical protein [Anaerolineales bacterium]